MESRECLDSGWLGTLELVRRISAYTREDRAKGFKVGITGNYARLAFQPDYLNSYDEMIALWRTDSVQRARKTEAELVKLYRTKCVRCFNARGAESASSTSTMLSIRGP